MAGIAENLSNPITAQRTMGVDLNKEVSDRVRTYKSNPKKLQERYQMSRELLDLLALQQIKSEQDAISRDLAIKQANMNPEANMTVKDKLAQTVVGTKTQEMASQIGGAYANMNKRKKAAMNKLATNAARRPMGIPAAMSRPATKKQGLGTLQGTTLAAKSGGIMPKFQTGEYVPTAAEERLIQEFLSTSTLEEIDAIAKDSAFKKVYRDAAQAFIDEYNTAKQDSQNQTVIAEQDSQNQTVIADKMENKTLTRPPSTDYSTALIGNITDREEARKILEEGGVGSFLEAQMGRDEDAFRKSYMEEAQKYIGMSPREQELMAGERARILKNLTDYQAESARMYSPEEERKRRLNALITGGALGGIGGGIRALSRQEGKEETSKAARGEVERGLSQQYFNLNNQAVRDAMGIRKEVFQLGAERYRDEVNRKFQAAGMKIGLNKDVLGQINNNAKLFITADWKDIDADLANAATNFKAFIDIGLANISNKLKADIANQTFQATLLQIDTNKELKRELNRSNDFATLSALRTSAEAKTAANIARLENIMGETVAELESAISYMGDTTSFEKERKADAIINKRKYEEEALRYMQKLKDENDALLAQIDAKLTSLLGGGSGGFTLLPSR
jgi:predicted GIY-YIG superfamily endonuclease